MEHPPAVSSGKDKSSKKPGLFKQFAKKVRQCFVAVMHSRCALTLLTAVCHLCMCSLSIKCISQGQHANPFTLPNF